MQRRLIFASIILQLKQKITQNGEKMKIKRKEGSKTLKEDSMNTQRAMPLKPILRKESDLD